MILHLSSITGTFPTRAKRRTRHQLRPAVEALEGRALLAPFAVGGDPSVHAADFRVTAFASGLNYPTGVVAEPDGSLLVVVNNPVTGGTNFYRHDRAGGSPGRFQRRRSGGRAADRARQRAPGSGFGDRAGGTLCDHHQQLRHDLLPPYRRDPGDPLTHSGSIQLAFPSGWWHTTFALAVRPAPGQPGDYNVFFNIGSQFNGIKKDAQGNILFDANGVAIPDPTVDTGAGERTALGDARRRRDLHGHAPRQRRHAGALWTDQDRDRPAERREHGDRPGDRRPPLRR